MTTTVRYCMYKFGIKQTDWNDPLRVNNRKTYNEQIKILISVNQRFRIFILN